jgi:outer membrane protein assembly factor BamB
MTHSRRRSLGALLGGAALPACDFVDRYIGGPSKTPLPGERATVLGDGTKLQADPQASTVAANIPQPLANESWPQPGGLPSHLMPHLSATGFASAWRTGIGSGANRDGLVTGSPVVANGRIYAVDAGTQLAAVDAATGARLWRFDYAPDGSRSRGVGGGVAATGDRIVLATGQAQVIALDASSGQEQWRQSLSAPFRAGPTVAGNRVFAISIDNQVHALDLTTGRKIWSYTGITENAGLYGGASPAVEGNVVVATFSSGEIFALRADSGRVMWGDSLAGALRTDAISALSDVRGLPVIDRGAVIAASHSGRIAMIDLRSGGRAWEQNVGSIVTPWVAGDVVFVTSVDAEIVALNRRDGRIRWVQQLERFTNAERKRGRIVWTGPTLISGRVFVANSQAQGVTLSPETGAVMERFRLPDSVTLAPIVANQTIYLLTDSADLIALR